MRAYSKQELLQEAQLLRDNFYCPRPHDLMLSAVDRLKPRGQISTVEWAENNRKFRAPEGGALIKYDRWRTPYNIAKMEALDDPTVERVVIVKPSRSGGTTVAENYLGRMIDRGPMGDVGWYLGSDDAVKKYCDRMIKPLFEDHPRLAAQIGSGKSENNDTSKRINGHLVEWLGASDNNMRNREFMLCVMDEPDGWAKFSENPETQMDARQKQIGSRKKGIIMSHPDKGWTAGAAAAWQSSSRGIYVMRCIECKDFASTHATKLWKGVPQFKLFYSRDEGLDFDERLAMAERTAGMLCPHCGALLHDEQRGAMNDEAGAEGWWMHRGQELDRSGGILGEMEPHKKRGFYDHGLMLKVSTAADLAKGLEEVLIKLERAPRSKVAAKAVREYLSKQLGEIYEGRASLGGLNSETLRQRTELLAKSGDGVVEFKMGQTPDQVRFITCFVDVGHRKFDVMLRGWDLERRSWVIKRWTILQPDGEQRQLDLLNLQQDWSVLDTVINLLVPIQGSPDKALPVAVMLIDSGDGNTQAQAIEYVRSRHHIRYEGWPRIWLTKGIDGDGRPHIKAGTELNKDDNGRPIDPPIKPQNMGVDGLKDDLLGNDDGFGFLEIDDGSPGQIYFPIDFARRHYDEIFAEIKIDGKYDRGGRPNETLDLLVGTEAGRLMLSPERKGREWNPPNMIWGRPVSLTDQTEGGDLQVAASGPAKALEPKKTFFEQYAELNQE